MWEGPYSRGAEALPTPFSMSRNVIRTKEFVKDAAAFILDLARNALAERNEFRIALSEESGNVALWMEMGEVAERAGRTATAADAYREASRLSPDNPQAKVALRRIEERRPSSGPSPHDER